MFDDLAVFMFSGFVKPPAMACHPEHGHGLPGCVYGPQTEIAVDFWGFIYQSDIQHIPTTDSIA